MNLKENKGKIFKKKKVLSNIRLIKLHVDCSERDLISKGCRSLSNSSALGLKRLKTFVALPVLSLT